MLSRTIILLFYFSLIIKYKIYVKPAEQINKGFILTAYIGTIRSLNRPIGCSFCYINAATANTSFYRCFQHHNIKHYKWIWTSLEEFYFIQRRISILSITGKKEILSICENQDFMYLQKMLRTIVLKKYINKKIHSLTA